jgi:hypothetical protein
MEVMTRRRFLTGAGTTVLALAAGEATSRGAGEPYLTTVRQYADAMLEHGRDRYGRERSPLFASALDRRTLRLPEPPVPKVPGTRSGDRCVSGGNPMHDEELYHLLYALSEVTGERRYAREAGKALSWFLGHCQSPATGLFAWGEHMGWDFRTEGPLADRDIHEFYSPWALWENCFALQPEACHRFARGLWEHQIADRKTGRFSRHARYSAHGPENGREFPRHGGFYIVTWAHAWKRSKEPELLDAIDRLVTSFRERRHDKTGVIPVDSRSLERVWPPGNLSLAVSLTESIALLQGAPDEVTARMRQCAESIDETFLKIGHDLSPGGKGFAMACHAGTLAPGDPAGETPPFTHLWATAYGEAMHAQIATLCLKRYDQVRRAGYRKLVLAAADRYMEGNPALPPLRISPKEEYPEGSVMLTPGALAATIALLLGAHRLTGEGRYRDRADFFGRKAIEIFWDDSPLPRASSMHGHYETLTGGDRLALVLLQLWSHLARPERPLRGSTPSLRSSRGRWE